MKRFALVVIFALVGGGCSGWTQKDTATAGKVIRCAQQCVQACVQEFTSTVPTCPAGEVKR